MKKIAALVLSVVMMLAVFTACSGGDPKTALVNSMEKTNALTSYESKADIKIKMEMAGLSLDMPTKANIKYVKKDGKVTMEMDMNLEAMGQAMEMKMFYSDGFMYVDSLGQKIKSALSLEEAEAMGASMSGMTLDMITEVVTEKTEGGTKYTPTIDDAKMTEFAKSAMSKAQSSMQGTPGLDAAADITFSNVKTYVVVGDNGYANEQWVSMDMVTKAAVPDATGASSEQEIKMSMEMTNTFVNPGQEVTVTLPEDLADYMESAPVVPAA